MAYNVPSYDTKRITFGPGILYLGAPGSTPSVDIGAVKGKAEITIERKKLEVKQGSPQTLVAQYAVEETVSLKVTGIEWNMDNLAYALGAGVTAVSGAEETLEFGGDMDVSSRALRYVHKTADGSTIDVHIFKAQGDGKISVSVNETEVHEFPYQFNALEGTTDFANQTLAAKKKLFKIIRTKV